MNKRIIIGSIFVFLIITSMPLVTSINANQNSFFKENEKRDCSSNNLENENKFFQTSLNNIFESFSDSNECNLCTQSQQPARCKILFFTYLLFSYPSIWLEKNGDSIFTPDMIIIIVLGMIIFGITLPICFLISFYIKLLGFINLCNVREWDERIEDIFD